MPTVIREYYIKMKQTVYHYYRELLMELRVIIWLSAILHVSSRTSLFLKHVGSWGEKNPFWPVIAQQETKNLLSTNQPNDTIAFFN